MYKCGEFLHTIFYNQILVNCTLLGNDPTGALPLNHLGLKICRQKALKI